MLTASQLVSLATQIAKGPGFITQAGQNLNSILSDLCQDYDLDAAKKTYNFQTNPATAPIGNLNVQLASGPFLLPVDYLRTKINDVLYFPSGLANFPLRLTPIDLGEFDGLVQQAGFQNFPVFWVTDMSQASPSAVTAGNAVATSFILNILSPNGIAVGNGVAGPGVQNGSIVTEVGTNSVIMNLPATETYGAGTMSYYFGTPPIAYVWPPASGVYPLMVRYYSQMPDIVTPEMSTVLPWFSNQEYLRKKLAASVMELTGDARKTAYDAAAEIVLDKFLLMKDDDTNRAKRVTLDPRRFGPDWSRLPKSKVFGY
jgi:hypothetical protein